MVVSTYLTHPLRRPLTVAVTGAGSGIGLAQCLAFLEQGAFVIGVDKSPLPKALMAYSKDQLDYQVVNLTEEKAIHQLADHCRDMAYPINVLCNTAGQLDGYHPLEETSVEEWQRILQTNLTSMFLMSKYFLSFLRQQKASRLINMASIAGLTAGGGGVAYTASKHAVIGLTKQIAYDYSTDGLRANAIAPGAIQTAMTQSDFEGNGSLAQWVADQTPVKRWAQAEEVAQLTLFLASDAADYIQGTVLPVDGGWMIR